MAASINDTLSKSILFDRDLAAINSKTESMFEAIFQSNTKLESSTSTMLRVITKVSRNCSTKLQLMEQRVMALEGARFRVDTSDHGLHQDAPPVMATMRQEENRFRNRVTGLGGQHSNPPQPPHTVPPIVVDLTTIFGQADVGGVTIDLSVNALFSMIQDLKAKQDVLMDCSSNTGIIFNN